MNEHELIKSILSNLTVGGETIPVEYIKYRGSSKTFVTYTFIDDEPRVYGEDVELHSVVSLDIDIFSDKNFLAIETTIRQIMESNNYIRTGCSPEMYEEDTGLYHKTIEYKKERMG